MSSSETATRRFLKQFAAGLLALAALGVGLTWLIDPLAALYPAGGGNLCTTGIKTFTARKYKFIAAVARQPREVLVGSSRVLVGFAHSDAERLLSRPTFNLGFHNASLADDDRVVRNIVRRAPVERVWLALEFGGFTRNTGEDRPLKLPAELPMPLFVWREGLLSPLALRITVSTMIRPSLCRSPPIDPYGFLNPVARSWRERSGFREIERLERTWGGPDQQDEQRYSARVRRLRELAQWLRNRRVGVVLLLSPMSESYLHTVERAGLAGRYRRWREDVRWIARREGAVLVESDTAAFLDSVPIQCQRGSTRDECFFYDTIHFRPEVGAAILAAGTKTADKPELRFRMRAEISPRP